MRHEQGAAHAAEGYARSTGKVGVLLVTSGPGATNAVTGLTDALMDSIPLVCITGQVPTHLIGSDAFQECDTIGITRHCTKHNYLVRRSRICRASCTRPSMSPSTGRPGPVVIDIPKDVQFASGDLFRAARTSSTRPISRRSRATSSKIEQAVDADGRGEEADLLHRRRRHQFRPGGLDACCANSSRTTGFPITSTLMGLGAYPASDKQLARHARHARHVTKPTMRCTIAI